MPTSIDPAVGADQASGLRRLLSPRALRLLPVWGMPGSTGQARFAVQLAMALAKCGRRVLIIDQSRGNVSNELRLRSRYELSHLLAGDREWGQVVLEGPPGVSVLPAARGLHMLAKEGDSGAFLDGLYGLSSEPDIAMLSVESPADVMGLVDPDGDWLLVAPVGSVGTMPAYRELKRVAQVARPSRVMVMLTGVASEVETSRCFGNLAAASKRFLDIHLQYGGSVAHSVPVPDARFGICSAIGQMASGVESWNIRAYRPTPKWCGTSKRAERRNTNLAWS